MGSLDQKELHIHVRNPENVLFEGYVNAVSSYNEKGPFDVLPLHESFISLIKKYLKIYQRNGQIKEIKVDTGVLKVFKNKIEVYLGI